MTKDAIRNKSSLDELDLSDNRFDKSHIDDIVEYLNGNQIEV
jgi:hypothetical protein